MSQCDSVYHVTAVTSLERLVSEIIGDGSKLTGHLDGEAGAYFALDLLDILRLKQADGWQFVPPQRSGS